MKNILDSWHSLPRRDRLPSAPPPRMRPPPTLTLLGDRLQLNGLIKSHLVVASSSIEQSIEKLLTGEEQRNLKAYTIQAQGLQYCSLTKQSTPVQGDITQDCFRILIPRQIRNGAS